MKNISFKKGTILQRSGDLNSNIYYVESGLLRSYSIDDKGKEHIFMFGPEGWIVSDNQSNDLPCDLFIDALEDTVVKVQDKNTPIENPDYKALIRRMGVLQKRIIMLMSASAIDRYEHFVETYPKITQRVPQKMIASYLGITPEALSKVKGERARRKN